MKEIVKSLIHKAGWVVHRFDPYAYPIYQLLQSLEYADVNLVFDIGANEGQFVRDLRWIGYTREIVSFEPLSTAHDRLLTAAKHDLLWKVHPRTAIGNFDGDIEINIAGNSVSSSVLPMLDLHASSETDSSYVGIERVPIARLDSVISLYLDDDSRYFIKIDTQGFEWAVLDGAVKSLRNARGLLCELSLEPLYKGQHPWREVIDRLEAEGFILWGILKGFTDKQNGRTLQVDGLFLRNEEEYKT